MYLYIYFTEISKTKSWNSKIQSVAQIASNLVQIIKLCT